MLEVKTPDEVLQLIREKFSPLENFSEAVGLNEAVGRVLSEDVTATEYIPDFDRSTVDGYALRASDTFGCSESIPALLRLTGEVLMGNNAAQTLPENACCYVPTGGAVPTGADCCVMIEHTENYGDGMIGILKAAAPGQNMIFRGEDVFPQKVFLKKGRVLASQDIGALAAAGIVQVNVAKRPKVAVLSTGDELVPANEKPHPGQVRDVNLPMLTAMLSAFGAQPVSYGILHDDESAICDTIVKAVSECDAVLVSGGSSVGIKDSLSRIFEKIGTVLLHGIAMKPGKPTILGKCGEKPLVGLPGHPAAAFFVTKLFVLPLLSRLIGREAPAYTVSAKLSENVSANDGRAQYAAVHLEWKNGSLLAHPVRSKSGLITKLAGADGYFCIGRDREGLSAGAEIQVTVCEGD